MSDRSIAGSIALITLGAVWVLAACSPRSETPPASMDASTTAPAPATEDAKTFTIGEFSAIALRDGAIAFPNDNKVLGVGHTSEEVAAVLTPAGLPMDELHLSIHPLLVKTTDRVLLFDTGAGTNMGTNGGKLAQSLADAGIDAGTITDIFISHAHGDHVGGLLNNQGAPAFPNAAIHISAPEWAFLRGMTAETAAAFAINQHPALVAAMTPKVAEFEPGADIIPGVSKAVEIRGHTPGHSGYLITSGQNSLLYIGDAMHHFVVSVQKPDWPIAFDSDAATAEASRRDLLARSAESGQRLYAVHFPFPGVGKVERRAEGLVWVPEYGGVAE